MPHPNPRIEQYRKELERHRQRRKQAIENKQRFEKKKSSPQPKTPSNTVVEIKERQHEVKDKSAPLPRMANTKVGWFTCKGRRDGIGAQALGVLSVMVTAKALDLSFVYKPFAYIEHCPVSEGKTPTERELKAWVDGFEKQLNFQKMEGVDHINILTKTIKTIDHRNILTTLRNGNLRGSHILATRETHTFNEHFREDPSVVKAWDEVISELNKVYGWDRKFLPHFVNNDEIEPNTQTRTLNIGIHIRKGDAEGNERRTLDLGYYLRVMKSILRSVLLVNDHNLKVDGPQYDVAFHIYSQGDLFHFTPLYEIEEENFSRIVFHLNVNVNETLHHLACADVLVMAKSTLSYLSALLNPNGAVVYYPFWLTSPKCIEDKWLQYKDVSENTFIDKLKDKLILLKK